MFVLGVPPVSLALGVPADTLLLVVSVDALIIRVSVSFPAMITSTKIESNHNQESKNLYS